MGDIQTMRVIEWMLRGSSIGRAVCPKQMTSVGSSPTPDAMSDAEIEHLCKMIRKGKGFSVSKELRRVKRREKIAKHKRKR